MAWGGGGEEGAGVQEAPVGVCGCALVHTDMGARGQWVRAAEVAPDGAGQEWGGPRAGGQLCPALPVPFSLGPQRPPSARVSRVCPPPRVPQPQLSWA